VLLLRVAAFPVLEEIIREFKGAGRLDVAVDDKSIACDRELG
jgi:hypothetical protein